MLSVGHKCFIYMFIPYGEYFLYLFFSMDIHSLREIAYCKLYGFIFYS